MSLPERPHYGRKLPGIKTEIIGEKAAFEEGQREMDARRKALVENRPQTVRVRLLGGPLDGGVFPVPRPMLQHRPGAEPAEIPIKVPRYKGKVVLPDSLDRQMHAIYRLDTATKHLRYVRTVHLPGGS